MEISGVDLVSHIDNGSRIFSKMGQVMSKVEKIGRKDKFWVPYSQWDGETFNKLWSTIWCKLDPYLRTKTQHDKIHQQLIIKIGKGRLHG